MLLDEPAAGLNESESDELLEIIRNLRERLGCGMLVVDHDLRLIMRVSERIHALAEGKTLPRARRSRCATTRRSWRPTSASVPWPTMVGSEPAAADPEPPEASQPG